MESSRRARVPTVPNRERINSGTTAQSTDLSVSIELCCGPTSICGHHDLPDLAKDVDEATLAKTGFACTWFCRLIALGVVFAVGLVGAFLFKLRAEVFNDAPFYLKVPSLQCAPPPSSPIRRLARSASLQTYSGPEKSGSVATGVTPAPVRRTTNVAPAAAVLGLLPGALAATDERDRAVEAQRLAHEERASPGVLRPGQLPQPHAERRRALPLRRRRAPLDRQGRHRAERLRHRRRPVRRTRAPPPARRARPLLAAAT